MDITKYVLSHRDSALLIGDHGTYRAQLSRQLATLRKRVGRATAKNAKYSPKPITSEDIGSNPEFAHVILLTAERAWAHALHMKSSHAEESSSKRFPGSTRSHIVSRLSKASKQAQLLLELLAQKSASGATDVDLLEARAYASYLSGLAEFEKHSTTQGSSDTKTQREKWQECLECLSISRVIYAVLLKKTKEEPFKEILGNAIDPGIRYAAYQSQIPRTVAITEVARRCFPQDDSKLVSLVEKVDKNAFKVDKEDDGSTGSLPNSISWRSRKANIVDASIGQALVSVSTAEEQLIEFLGSKNDKLTPKTQAAAYDDVLIASQDAVDATRHAIDEHEKEKVSESDPRMQDLRVTSLVVNYDLIGWRVGRNRVLIGGRDGVDLDTVSTKPVKQRTRRDGQEVQEKPEGRGRKLARLRDRVVLYDAILQSIDSVKDLRGAVRDAEFIEELEAKRAYFQALKCLNIAYSHVLLSNLKNALALLIRAELLCSGALPTILASKPPTSAAIKLDIHPTTAKSFHEFLQLQIHQYRGLVELHNFNDNSKIAAQKNLTSAAPAIERLDEYPAGGVDLSNLVAYPPKLQPVPVKPLFFDVAWNYIAYPGTSSAAALKSDAGVTSKASAEEDKKPAKKGWFPFVRS